MSTTLAPTAPPTPTPIHDTTDELHGRARTLALTALFMSSAVSMISMTVVATSMPIIIGELRGTQSQYTWVVTATMLASAISTPIWGKLADLTSKKVLLQLALVIFVAGSALAGTSTTANFLILYRVLQGLGAGGLGALVQIVLAEIISPRERGKYMGIMGAIMAVGTVGGPLLGGWITDTLSWRWNFYVAAPIALAAILMLQFTVHLHTEKRPVQIDSAGAVLISAGFSSLLIWVTLAGSAQAVAAGTSQFEWASWPTAAMVGGGLLLLGLAVVVERRVAEPLIPMALFANRTFTMAVLASVAVGLGMFGTSVFLGQYMQLARGKTPTVAGLLTIPMMAGVLVSSTIIGQIISRTGVWKRYMVAGSITLAVGLFMMGWLRADTSYTYVGVSMFVLGAGVGMCMQNLVLVVQNTVDPHQIGVASSAVNFFRTIGGTAGMSALGALVSHQIVGFLGENLRPLTDAAQAAQTDPTSVDPALLAQLRDCADSLATMATGAIPEIAKLCDPVRLAVEGAYGHAIGDVFLAAAPVALVAIIAIACLPNIPLGRLTNAQKLAAIQAQIRDGQAEEPVEPTPGGDQAGADQPSASLSWPVSPGPDTSPDPGTPPEADTPPKPGDPAT